MRKNIYLTLALCLLFPAIKNAWAFESYLLWNAIPSSDIRPFYKWNSMVARYAQQRQVPDSQCNHIKFYPCEVVHWKTLTDSLRRQPLVKQLVVINDYANSYPYITDPENWGVDDYWETPHEFLTVSGNCKDYAIIKYYSLRMMGIPASQLRVIIVQDLNLGGIIHAILGVYVQNNVYILDNQIKQVVFARQIYHYKPIYAINEDGWWRYIPRNN